MSFIRTSLRKKKKCVRCGTLNNKKFPADAFNCQETYRKHVFINTEPLLRIKKKWLTA